MGLGQAGRRPPIIYILLGDHDEAISRTHTDYLAKTIPGAKLVILENAISPCCRIRKDTAKRGGISLINWF